MVSNVAAASDALAKGAGRKSQQLYGSNLCKSTPVLSKTRSYTKGYLTVDSQLSCEKSKECHSYVYYNMFEKQGGWNFSQVLQLHFLPSPCIQN